MKLTKNALIVGASRGIGLAIVEELLKRNWNVVGTVRSDNKTKLHDLADKGNPNLVIKNVDITIPSQIDRLKSDLAGSTFNVLFVNAGVANEKGMDETIGEISTEEFIRVMVTNTLAPMRVLERLKDYVTTGGVLGAMSSGQGSIADNENGGNDVYRASKAALNMVMRSFATRHGKDHALLLLAPGWIKTDMGGKNAKFSLDDVIGNLVDTITSQEGRTGLRFLDRFGNPVRW
ncbi:MAG: SDR family NAD(P)-dependent oxidoreductase [Spirochaetales bacterium]|nr:SDR family NAD(P)-dependent oxidoreductase [Spirochaetales bacterium]